MPLYGNELDRETNPYEAGLGRVVKLDKAGDFVGRAALEKVADDGAAARSSSASRCAARGIARHGYPVLRRGDARRPASSPAARCRRRSGEAIAMAYVPPAACRTRYHAGGRDPRRARCAAEVVPLPFYKRPG